PGTGGLSDARDRRKPRAGFAAHRRLSGRLLRPAPRFVETAPGLLRGPGPSGGGMAQRVRKGRGALFRAALRRGPRAAFGKRRETARAVMNRGHGPFRRSCPGLGAAFLTCVFGARAYLTA